MMLKDQAARTYQFLVMHGAMRQEAVSVIQRLLSSYVQGLNLAQAPTFEHDALSKRGKVAGALEHEEERRALEMLPSSGKRALSRGVIRNKEMRESAISSIAHFLLSRHVAFLDWSNVIPSTVSTKPGRPCGKCTKRNK